MMLSENLRFHLLQNHFKSHINLAIFILICDALNLLPQASFSLNVDIIVDIVVVGINTENTVFLVKIQFSDLKRGRELSTTRILAIYSEMFCNVNLLI